MPLYALMTRSGNYTPDLINPSSEMAVLVIICSLCSLSSFILSRVDGGIGCSIFIGLTILSNCIELLHRLNGRNVTKGFSLFTKTSIRKILGQKGSSYT